MVCRKYFFARASCFRLFFILLHSEKENALRSQAFFPGFFPCNGIADKRKMTSDKNSNSATLEV